MTKQVALQKSFESFKTLHNLTFAEYVQHNYQAYKNTMNRLNISPMCFNTWIKA